MKIYKKIYLIAFFITSFFCIQPSLAKKAGPNASSKEDPQISVSFKDKTLSFSRSKLLVSAHLQKITVPNDPSYHHKAMSYMAVPIADLFKDFKIPENASIVFFSKDNFSAPLDKAKLFNTSADSARAFIAIEPADQPWPPLKKSSPSQTAGPFYLIWQDAAKSKIGQEEWPFQLTGFQIQPSLAEQYPEMVPGQDISPEDSVFKGFAVFTKNCFACHSINSAKAEKMGPDLNIPFNPTEYFKEAYIQKLIRNPQNLRHWTSSKMSGFSKESISDQELEELISYLQYMSHHKK